MRRSLLLAAALMFAPGGVHGDVVLEIYWSDPSEVAFAATTANSQINQDFDSETGITLLSFFDGTNAHTANDNVLDGSLDVLSAPTGTTRIPLGTVFVDVFPGGWTLQHLNIYHRDGPSMFFRTDAPALVGAAIHDLSDFSGLPSVGASGDIVAGPPNMNHVIGQWLVVGVPEAGGFLLTATAAAGTLLAAWLRVRCPL